MSLTQKSSRTLLYKKMFRVRYIARIHWPRLYLPTNFIPYPALPVGMGLILDEELIHLSIESGLPTCQRLNLMQFKYVLENTLTDSVLNWASVIVAVLLRCAEPGLEADVDIQRKAGRPGLKRCVVRVPVREVVI